MRALGTLIGGWGGGSTSAKDERVFLNWPRLSAAGTSDIVDDKLFKEMGVDVDVDKDDER